MTSLRTALRQHLGPWLIGSAVAAVLLAVFLAYLAPETVVDLSNRFWSCF